MDALGVDGNLLIVIQEVFMAEDKKEVKKCFITRMFEALDKKMKEKAAGCSSCCCGSDSKEQDKGKKCC